jgi:hypothetical protein
MAELFATEPPRGPAKGLAIAAGVLILVAAAVFWFNPHKQAEGHLTNFQLYATSTKLTDLTGQSGTHVIGTGPSTEDDLYVVATVQVDNQLRLPLFINGSQVELIQPDNTEVDGLVVSAHDVPRLTETYPDLGKLAPQPLPFQAEAPPKGSVTGSIIAQFPSMTESMWKGKKSARIRLLFAHQDPLVITLP